MTSERPISIAPPPPSFGSEQRELLQRRCRLVYLLSFLVAGAVYAFYVWVDGDLPRPVAASAPSAALVYDVHVMSFAVAALLMFARSWSVRWLLGIDLTLFACNIMLTHYFAVVFDRGTVPVFAVSMLLFLHAAVIPLSVGAQVSLGVVAAFGYAVTAALGFALVPEVQRMWLDGGGVAAVRGKLLEGTFQLSILALLSVAMTKALYNMRLSLHRARRLGNYVLKGELGEGGMGQVYVAEHALMSRPTAVKVLKAPSGEDDAWLARFEREVRLSAGLSHPNTITVYDFGRSGRDTFYYAMEYLDGLNLDELVTRFGPVQPERAVFILAQVCGSLAEAHENGIVHRDVKPANILLTCRGGMHDYVKVCDFGLARPIESGRSGRITRSGVFLGTPQYVAPEVATASARVDGRADLYGLGGVAYWMLVGRPPFEAGTTTGFIVEHLRTRPTPPADLSEVPIPAELDRIVMRCLEKDPADRFSTAGEVEAALHAIGFDEPWTWDRARAWWAVHRPKPAARRAVSSS